MSAVNLYSDDLAELAKLTKDLNFEDIERREALLENNSRDFNAVPGSGKTSLLAAKLLLLAKKWPHSRRGICVLSHTNVAREEITRRLEKTTEGAQLLSYPHFIGTIHSFVNQFFAMPILRSLGKKVDVIDDQVFADKAMSLLQKKMFNGLRTYLEHQTNGNEIASTLFYRTAGLELRVESGKLPASHTASYKSLVKLKNQLSSSGVFRHRDMFAFADLALKKCPKLIEVVHRRFPIVFIDEMQDTSWEQESFLNSIFHNKSVVQRFGDIDQKILSDEENSEQLTFPRIGHGCISTSKRFGKTIADAVGSVRVSGKPVIGDGEDSIAPVLILYRTSKISEVLSFFGSMVIERISEKDICDRHVKAMCARKAGESNVDLGRHLLDYMPTYSGQSSLGKRSESFWCLVGDPQETLRETSLISRVSDIRRSLFLVLRDAGAPLALDIRDARSLPKAAKATVPSGSIEKLTRKLALFGKEFCLDNQREAFIQLLYTELKIYLPETLDLDGFKRLSVFEDTGASSVIPSTATTKSYQVVHLGRCLDFGLGTIAGMKGETHEASLVMESYGGTSRKFDVAMGLEYIAGVAQKQITKLPKTQLAQMRNLYVAMSRPTTFLCLAANESRVPDSLRDALTKKGWQIKAIT